jgi:hypothetical protein
MAAAPSPNLLSTGPSTHTLAQTLYAVKPLPGRFSVLPSPEKWVTTSRHPLRARPRRVGIRLGTFRRAQGRLRGSPILRAIQIAASLLRPAKLGYEGPRSRDAAPTEGLPPPVKVTPR